MKILKLMFFTCFIFSFQVYSQWLDPQTLRNVVLIEIKDSTTYKPFGTGFLMWNYKNSSFPVVVTCGHLLKRSELYITINADSSLISAAKKANIDTLKTLKHNWIIDKNKLRTKIILTRGSVKFHPNMDIGAFLLDIPRGEIKDDSGKVSIKLTDAMLIAKSFIRYKKEISLGTEVYFIGFPFGIGGFSEQEFVEPLVRSGSVAWLSKSSNEFLLDAFSYGGNSGSPIYLKGILGSKVGELKWSNSFLIGMIIGHHSLTLKDILTQPNPAELKFEKKDMALNLGLARCIWIDDIMTVVEEASRLNILPD